jgi:hypothetical protein
VKTLVFQTDRLGPRELVPKRIFWVKLGSFYQGGRLEMTSTVVLSTPPLRLADMLVEIEDGVTEIDAREAIQAAALALDWTLAGEIAARYGWVVCLRCASDVQNRPTWRLHRLGIKGNWSEICGSCAVEMLELAAP